MLTITIDINWLTINPIGIANTNEIIKGEKTRKEFFNEILDMLTLLGGDVGNVK